MRPCLDARVALAPPRTRARGACPPHRPRLPIAAHRSPPGVRRPASMGAGSSPHPRRRLRADEHRELAAWGAAARPRRRAGAGRCVVCASSASGDAAERACWDEYEAACEAGDLQGALRGLDQLKAAGAFPAAADGAERALRILNLVAAPDTERLVSPLYELLVGCGLMPNFGAAKDAVAPLGRVTPADLAKATGRPAAAFSPSRGSQTVRNLGVVAAVFAVSRLGVLDVALAAAALLSAVVAVEVNVTGGVWTGKAMNALLPGRRRRIAAHEAGHLLVAYLLGKPVRGVLLDMGQASKAGLPGTAGTLFWDRSLERGLQNGTLKAADFDQYCVVVFAGIAAEVYRYGQAEGGGSDEQLYRAVAAEIKPPWPRERVANQARWAVAEANRLIRANEGAYHAAREALEEGRSLADAVRAIESSFLNA